METRVPVFFSKNFTVYKKFTKNSQFVFLTNSCLYPAARFLQLLRTPEKITVFHVSVTALSFLCLNLFPKSGTSNRLFLPFYRIQARFASFRGILDKSGNAVYTMPIIQNRNKSYNVLFPNIDFTIQTLQVVSRFMRPTAPRRIPARAIWLKMEQEELFHGNETPESLRAQK